MVGNQARFTMMVGCTFVNQEEAVFHVEIFSPMVIVGFHIKMDDGPINTSLPEYDGLNMIDGVIELGSGPLIQNTNILGNLSNIYISNVYVKGASKITNNWSIDNPGEWTRIDEYSFCEPRKSRNLIDGVLNQTELKEKTENLTINPKQLSNELISKHVWDDNSFPHFQSEGVCNVKDASQMNGKPAVGDGVTDDTQALEYAIANYNKIFLPKGTYMISRTLMLESNTRIFGISKSYVSVKASGSWNNSNGNSIITTVDDARATTSISFLNIISSTNHPFTWRAGRNSLVRNIRSGYFTYTGNGGGRLFQPNHTHSRLVIDGTHEPLYIYTMNPERATDPESEVKNSENIRIFFLKTEAGTDGKKPMRSIKIANSRNIAIYGVSGNVQLNESPGMAMIDIINCEDILITQARPWKTGSEWYTLKESFNGVTNTVASETRLSLFKRGSLLLETNNIMRPLKTNF